MKLYEIWKGIKEESTIKEKFKVYHGSGYKFDKFLSSFIGSGIGNGFGYGIYLTDSKSDAKEWAKTLEQEDALTASIDNKTVSKELTNFIKSAVNTHGNKPEIILAILRSYSNQLLKDNNIDKSEYELIQSASAFKLNRSRFVYEVEVNGSDFIDWQSPVSMEQVNKIQAQSINGSNKLDISVNGNEISVDGKPIKNGNALYNSIPGTQKDKSEFLMNCGIDGVVYRDGGGMNYVVFDPNILRIVKRIQF